MPPAPSPAPAPAAGFLGRFAKIEKGEGAAVAVSFFLYFCVLGGYFMVRPVRETVGTIIGRAGVADLFGWTWALSIALIPIYGIICGLLPRRVFLPLVYGFVAVALAACGFVFLDQGDSHPTAGKAFYVMISVLNLFMVSVLWSFLLDLFNAAQVKRLFGFIAAGGTAGAFLGPMAASELVTRIGNSGILFVGASMFAVAIGLQIALLRIWQGPPVAGTPAAAKDRPIGGNPLAGIWIVLKSPYLLGIVTFVLCLAAVNTFLYFEQIDFVTALYPDDTRARTAFFSRFDYTVQGLTILCQLFATGRIAARWGTSVLLTVVPLVMVVGLLGFAAFHTITVLVIVYCARRVGEYAFVRPGREMLFSRVDPETKYKAKNFIDVPVYRGGDYLFGQVMTSPPGWIAPGILGAIIAAAWAVNGWWLGRRTDRMPPASRGGANGG